MEVKGGDDTVSCAAIHVHLMVGWLSSRHGLISPSKCSLID